MSCDCSHVPKRKKSQRKINIKSRKINKEKEKY